MSKTMGPNALEEALERLGLALVKVQDLPGNVGKSAALVACERLEIKPRNYIARWRNPPVCGRCAGKGHVLVGTMEDEETCPVCGGRGWQ